MGITKTSGPNKFMLGAGLLGGAGALYGMGDSEHNYYNELLHNSTAARASQGVLGGLAGVGGYKAMRGLGRSRGVAGLAALLSSAGAAALANPHLTEENPYKLPF